MLFFHICLICWWLFEYNRSTSYIYGICSFNKSLLPALNIYWIHWFDICHAFKSFLHKETWLTINNIHREKFICSLQVKDNQAVKNILSWHFTFSLCSKSVLNFNCFLPFCSQVIEPTPKCKAGQPLFMSEVTVDSSKSDWWHVQVKYSVYMQIFKFTGKLDSDWL